MGMMVGLSCHLDFASPVLALVWNALSPLMEAWTPRGLLMPECTFQWHRILTSSLARKCLKIPELLKNPSEKSVSPHQSTYAFNPFLSFYWRKTHCLITSWQSSMLQSIQEKLKTACIWQAFKNVRTVLNLPPKPFLPPRWNNCLDLVSVSSARHLLDVLDSSSHESCREYIQGDFTIHVLRWVTWGSEQSWPEGTACMWKVRPEP